jgi:hypothetical protein
VQARDSIHAVANGDSSHVCLLKEGLTTAVRVVFEIIAIPAK